MRLNYLTFSAFLLMSLMPAWLPGLSWAQNPPAISNIQRAPEMPSSGQDVTVTATVTADTTIATVTIVELNVGDNINMQQAGGSTFQATIPGVIAGTQVNFRIRATDDAGRVSTSGQQSYTTGLAAPSNLTAELDENAGEITLNWSPVAGATGYSIFRALEPPADLLLIDDVTETTFIDDKIGSARELYYRVKATRGNLESNFSDGASVNMVFNTAPFTPSGSRYEALIVANREDVVLLPELQLDLNTLFEDADGDLLTYRFLTPPSGDLVTSASISETILSLAFTGQLGAVQFSILADDGRFGQAVISFFVTLDAPPIVSAPVIGTTPEKDKPLSVTVEVEDNNLERVEINFRRGGDESLFTDEMTPATGNTFEYTIPAFAIGERGLEYSIAAMDNNDLVSFQPQNTFLEAGNPYFSLEVNVPGEGIRKETPQPVAGSTPNAYRLISIPLALDDVNPARVFEDDLGAYKNSKWRLFQPLQNTASAALPEFPNTPEVTPGAAFWLIVRDENRIIDSGPGKTIPLDMPFEIELQPGWNYFGNPFVFDVPLSQMMIADGNPLDIRFFDGAGWVSVADTSSIQPFEGYAISNNSNIPGTLRIYSNKDLLTALNPTKKQSQQQSPQHQATLIGVVAKAGGFLDTNHILLQESSETGWDPLDLPEPPTIGDFVSVSFPHPDWSQPLKLYSRDARPVPASGDTWDVEVTSTIGQSVQLEFTGIQSLPDHLDVLLIDEQLQVTQRLSENNKYQVSSTSSLPQKLKLVIGTASFINTREADISLLVDTFALLPGFPNPFNKTTTLPFDLPKESNVTLQVFNLLGERVATLISSTLPAGRHNIIWNGANDAGTAVANGLYVVRFTADNFVATRKVLVLR